MRTRETRNASYAAVATSDAGEGRRRGWHAPTTRERERRARNLGRRRDDERFKRRPTAPEAHVEMETRGTRNASNVIVTTSDVREYRRRGMRAPTTRERESHASGLGRRRDNERRKRRSAAPGAYVEMGTRQTGNASNAVVATQAKVDGAGACRRHASARHARVIWSTVAIASDASEDRWRLRHTPKWKR